jgi:hypothetical protein
MMPCPHCGLPHTGPCRSSAQRNPEILSTAYSEIKEKISHTRLASKGLDDWAYRGAIRGAFAGFLLFPLLTLFVTGKPEAACGGMLCFGLPAALFGGLIGVVVAIIGFYLSRPSFRAQFSDLERFEQEYGASSQRPGGSPDAAVPPASPPDPEQR